MNPIPTPASPHSGHPADASEDFAIPGLSMLDIPDLCQLMLATGMSSDSSDKAFCKACRNELARRKPK